jgi:hypothetical protein
MATGTREEIRIGQLAIRFLVEGNDSGGPVAIFELDVPAGAKVPSAHSHDAYEETICRNRHRRHPHLHARRPQNRNRPRRRRALHPSKSHGSGPPLRQSSRCQLPNAGNRQSRHPRPGLLPRNRRRRQSRSRPPTRP